jgi:hypothetical protein
MLTFVLLNICWFGLHSEEVFQRFCCLKTYIPLHLFQTQLTSLSFKLLLLIFTADRDDLLTSICCVLSCHLFMLLLFIGSMYLL